MPKTRRPPPLRPVDTERLVMAQPFIRRLARIAATKLPTRYADPDELTAAANLRLVRDLPRWDKALGQSLKTFIGHRARAGMLDWLRTQDHLSRKHRLQAGAAAPRLVALGNPTCSARGPLQLLEGGLWDEYRPLRLVRLDWRERIVLALLILEGWTLAPIGMALGLSESRVSQIVQWAGIKLREATNA